MAVNEIYGIGGFDSSKPNNNVISTETVADPQVPVTLGEIAAEFASIESVADVEAFRAALEGLL